MELLGPTVVNIGIDAFPTTELGNTVFASKALQDNPDLNLPLNNGAGLLDEYLERSSRRCLWGISGSSSSPPRKVNDESKPSLRQSTSSVQLPLTEYNQPLKRIPRVWLSPHPARAVGDPNHRHRGQPNRIEYGRKARH